MPGQQRTPAPTTSADQGSTGTSSSGPSAVPGQSTYGNNYLAGIAQRDCSYTVQPGDTLWGISGRELGAGNRWGDLYSENQDVVGDNPDLIYPGQELNVCLPQDDPNGVSRYGADVTQMSEADAAAARADRLAAQQELRGRFDIVPDDFVGPRLPNQVTQAEFEQTASLYSDIRMGHSNFRFDNTGSGKTADEFRNAALGDIASILTTSQGRGLLNEMAYQEVDGHDYTTTIGHSATPGGAGAVVGPGGVLADTVNGTGTNAGVNYQPGVNFRLGDTDADYANDPYANFSSDVVLFHELVHANHARQGILDGNVDPATGAFSRDPILNAEATIPRDQGVAREEYNTVGIGGYGGTYTENAYRNERSLVTGIAIPTRDNYAGSGP